MMGINRRIKSENTGNAQIVQPRWAMLRYFILRENKYVRKCEKTGALKANLTPEKNIRPNDHHC